MQGSVGIKSSFDAGIFRSGKKNDLASSPEKIDEATIEDDGNPLFDEAEEKVTVHKIFQ